MLKQMNHRFWGLYSSNNSLNFVNGIRMNLKRLNIEAIFLLLLVIAVIVYQRAKLPQLDFNNVYDETVL